MQGLLKMAPGEGAFVYRDDLPIPEPGDDEVLIKVHCTAICQTDIHIIEWDDWSKMRIHPPVIVGHETAGDIVAVGRNVTERHVGDRVSCESHISCGDCWFCKNGMPHICKNTRLFGCTVNGAFADYAVIPWYSTFLLDEGLSYEAACMFEPMGAGVHGVENAHVEGQNVLISGCGPIGLTAVAAAKVLGAKYIIACDLVDEKLETALQMGADRVVNSGREDLVATVLELTDGIGVDRAVDITGAGPAIRSALKCLRAAGRLVSVGLPTKHVELDLANDVIYREIEMTGISGRLIWKTWEDFAKVMQSPYYDLANVIGRKFALKDYEKAFEAIAEGVPGKMLLYPGGVD